MERTSKIKDLTGQKFGRLTAVRPTMERKRGYVVWECHCDCGNTAFVPSGWLLSGSLQSCGCLKRERVGVKNLTGQKFGKLTVVRAADQGQKNRYKVWECKCDCGNTVFVESRLLVNGTTKSCGCLSKAEDLTGQKFGRLTAVRKSENQAGKSKRTAWVCQCDCGNLCQVNATNLKSGRTRSCGCLRSEKMQTQNPQRSGRDSIYDFTSAMAQTATPSCGK